MRGDLEDARRAPRVYEVRRHRCVVACCGAALTLLLHALLISPLLWGGGQRVRTPTRDEGGATSGVPAMTLVMLDDTADPRETERPSPEKLSEVLSSARVLVPIGSLHLANAVTPPAIEESSVVQPDNPPSASEGERALMFGRYLGQVTARIERAWLRPRSAISSESFTCWVQVEQDRERNVKEVTLKECNGTTAWQLSLVRAIESASPFPAPPDPSVFSPILTFEISADPYREGGSVDGYEPVTLKDIQAASAQAANDAFGEMMAKIRASQHSGARVIDIRIERTRPAESVSPMPDPETSGRERGVAAP